MKFHHDALTLIGKPVSAGDSSQVDDAEKCLGITLPAAIREWYSEVDGRAVLQTCNDDHVLSPTEFTLNKIDGRPLVKFMTENQGVCWWGFLLGDTDDPPVYVNVDPPPDKLFEYSPRFTEFTYVQLFDHERMPNEELCSMDICDPISSDELAFLESTFKVEPQSKGWPSPVVYRFSSSIGRITIWAGNEQSDWILSANSPSDLAAIREQVIHLWRGHFL